MANNTTTITDTQTVDTTAQAEAHTAPVPAPTELLTKKELAKKLKVTTRSIDNFVKRGVIPKLKIGTAIRFDWNKVVASLENLQAG